MIVSFALFMPAQLHKHTRKKNELKRASGFNTFQKLLLKNASSIEREKKTRSLISQLPGICYCFAAQFGLVVLARERARERTKTPKRKAARPRSRALIALNRVSE